MLPDKIREVISEWRLWLTLWVLFSFFKKHLSSRCKGIAGGSREGTRGPAEHLVMNEGCGNGGCENDSLLIKIMSNEFMCLRL